MKNIRTGIIFGIIAGLLTFLFGGWSVAVIGCLMGVGLGMGLGGRFERKDPLKIAVAVLPTALVAGAILVALSLYQNNVVQDAIGKRPASDEYCLVCQLDWLFWCCTIYYIAERLAWPSRKAGTDGQNDPARHIDHCLPLHR